jgi:hypothetical protein
MKAEELRRFNLLDNCKQTCFVLEIYKNNKIELGYYKDSIGFVRSLADIGIKPIPLTEEWLLKFGFLKNLTSWTNWEKPNNTKEVRLIIQGKYLFYNGRIIEHVHQLQNLYYSLTGEELELKEL